MVTIRTSVTAQVSQDRLVENKNPQFVWTELRGDDSEGGSSFKVKAQYRAESVRQHGRHDANYLGKEIEL